MARLAIRAQHAEALHTAGRLGCSLLLLGDGASPELLASPPGAGATQEAQL